MSRKYSLSASFAILLVLWSSEVICKTVENPDESLNQRINQVKKFTTDLSAAISPQTDLCDNFYEKVCRNVNKSPTYSQHFEKIGEMLENYLTETEKLSEVEMKMKTFLESCKQIGKEDLREFVKNFNFPNSIGGWPALTPNWSGDKFDLQKAIAELGSYSIPVLIEKMFPIKPENFQRMLMISTRNIELVKYTKTKIEEKMKKIGIENYNEIIKEALEFEQEFLNVLKTSESTEDMETNFGNLKKEIPEIDWDQQIKAITNQEIKDDYPVLVLNSGPMKKMIKAISKAEPKTVANYFFCTFIFHLPNIQHNNFEDSCTSHAYSGFHSVISGIFLKKFYSGKTKTALNGLITSLLYNLQKTLPVYENPVAKEIVENLDHTIKEKYLPSFSDENLKEEYREVQIEPNMFLKNSVALRRMIRIKHLEVNVNEDPEKNSELFTRRLSTILPMEFYKFGEEPLPFVFISFASRFIQEYTEELVDLGRLDFSAVRECLPKEGTPSEDKDFLPFMHLKILAKSYLDWADKNEELFSEEENVFKEFGLTSEKVFLIRLAQYTCKEDDIFQPMLGHIENINEFREVLNCPLKSTVHSQEECYTI